MGKKRRQQNEDIKTLLQAGAFFGGVTALGVGSSVLGLGFEGMIGAVILAGGTAYVVPKAISAVRNNQRVAELLEYSLTPGGSSYYRRQHKEHLIQAPRDGGNQEEQNGDPQLSRGIGPTGPVVQHRPTIGQRLAHRPTIIPGPGELELAPDFCPHINMILGLQLLCLGTKGSGKTNFGARLAEQIGRHRVPMIIFDVEGDYVPIVEICIAGGLAGPSALLKDAPNPNSYICVDSLGDAQQLGRDILNRGWQMVLDMHAYKWPQRAELIIGVIAGLIEAANEFPRGQRVPCVMLLDEAQQFFPQNAGLANSRFGQALYMQLANAYQEVVAMGRKRGFTPFFFTQRLAQIDKSAVGQVDIEVYMKTSLDIDIERVLDSLKDKDPNFLTASEIFSFPAGTAAVKAYTGDLFLTRFYERETVHLSPTPKLEDAVAWYGDGPATPEPGQAAEERMPDLPMRGEPVQEEAAVPQQEKKEEIKAPIPAPVVPEKSRRAKDVPLVAAVKAWNGGINTVSLIMEVFDLKNNQARILRDMILAQANAKRPDGPVEHADDDNADEDIKAE